MKPYTRKQFLELSIAASASLALSACGLNDGGKSKKTTAIPDTATPTTKAPPKSAVKIDLVDKTDPRYDMLRKGFNKRIDKYPKMIALCTTTEEVAAAVRYAHEQQLPIAVKSGGHSMEGFSCNDGGMVINLSKMNSVELTGDQVKVGAGLHTEQFV